MMFVLEILKKIGWFLKRVFWFVIDNWKIAVPAILIVCLLFSFGMWKACSTPEARFNEEQIHRLQKAIAEDDRKEMLKVLEESKVEEAKIDGNLANAENEKLKVLSDIRKETAKKSNAELAAELERLAREQ